MQFFVDFFFLIFFFWGQKESVWMTFCFGRWMKTYSWVNSNEDFKAQPLSQEWWVKGWAHLGAQLSVIVKPVQNAKLWSSKPQLQLQWPELLLSATTAKGKCSTALLPFSRGGFPFFLFSCALQLICLWERDAFGRIEAREERGRQQHQQQQEFGFQKSDELQC